MEKIKVNMSFFDDEELRKDMLKEFLEYPKAVQYVKKLGIPDELIGKNIAKIYNFLLDLKYCEKCPGLANCGKSQPTLCTKLTYENGVVDRELTICKKALQKLEAEAQFLVKDFEPSWLDANIASIDNVNSDLGRKEIAKKFTQWVNKKFDGWMYINGENNTGRSYVVAVLCNKLIAEKGLGPVAFINSSSRIKELTDLSYSKEKVKFEKLLDRYSEVPVLVFDDFGDGFLSDYIRDAIIQPILARRATKRLLTIFTSNYTIDEVGELLTTNKNGGAIKAEQIKKIIKSLAGKEINLGSLAIY